jgi:hypothetical protein
MNTCRHLALASLLLLYACGGKGDPGGNTHPDQPLPTNSVAGTVAFQGTPLAGAKVTLFQTNTSSIVATATTDAAGAYSFSGLSASGYVPADYLIWVNRTGYGFYPTVGTGGKVVRCGQNGFLQGNRMTDIGMDVTAIEYVSTPHASLSGANFSAFDGTNPRVSLARTGQLSSQAPWDDGAQRRGLAWPSPRFTDLGDGTVRDQLTGLVWLQDAGVLPPTTWSSALGQVAQLASGAAGLKDGSRAGDWRVPNLVELESLLDASAANPALPAGNPFLHVSNGVYWTSTSYYGGIGGSPSAWTIRLGDGRYMNDSNANAKATAMNGVWAVKGRGPGTLQLQATGLWPSYTPGDDGNAQSGVPLPFPRWVDKGDGTVTDTLTGLVWLKQANAIHLPWTQALAAVQALASGQYGLTDGSTAGSWRMPTRREMQSLADRIQNNHADYFNYTFRNLDGTTFQAPVFSSFISYQFYWTSTTDAADPTRAWTVFSCDFGVYDTAKTEIGYTLAVR